MIVTSAPSPDEETARMARAKRNTDPRGKPTEPGFLRPHKKQKEDLRYGDVAGLEGSSQVNIASSVFRPVWGFRKQDTVVGSIKHAMDWSLNSITPPDYKDLVVNGDIGESEAMGAQALATANAHFQSLVHQSKAWKQKAKAFETESQKRSLQNHQLGEQMKKKDEELISAHAEVVALKDNREKLIDDYLESDEYKSIVDQHDDMLFPGQFTQGWNEALEAVLKKHPGLFQVSDFPSPHLPISLTIEGASSEELFGEGDSRVKEHAATSGKGKEKEKEDEREDSGSSSTTKTSESSPKSASKASSKAASSSSSEAKEN